MKTYERGINLQKNGYHNEAIERLSKIIVQNKVKYLVSAYVNRAQAHKDLGQYSASLKDIRKADELDKDNDRIDYSVFEAELHLRLGDLGTSIDQFEEIIALGLINNFEPGIIEFIRCAYASVLIRNNQFEEAERQADLVLQNDALKKEQKLTVNGTAYFIKSVVQILLGKYDKAIELAEKAVFTEYEVRLFPLGAVAANLMGDYDEALDILEDFSDQKAISTQQRAVFQNLKKILKRVKRNSKIEKIDLPQENMERLKKLSDFKVVVNNTVVAANKITKGYNVNFKLNP